MAVFWAAMLAAAATAAAATPRYNVLMIVVDDLRPQFGAYGVPYMHTPNVDRLASEVYIQLRTCQPQPQGLQGPICRERGVRNACPLRIRRRGHVHKEDSCREHICSLNTTNQPTNLCRASSSSTLTSSRAFARPRGTASCRAGTPTRPRPGAPPPPPPGTAVYMCVPRNAHAPRESSLPSRRSHRDLHPQELPQPLPGGRGRGELDRAPRVLQETRLLDHWLWQALPPQPARQLRHWFWTISRAFCSSVPLPCAPCDVLCVVPMRVGC